MVARNWPQLFSEVEPRVLRGVALIGIVSTKMQRGRTHAEMLNYTSVDPKYHQIIAESFAGSTFQAPKHTRPHIWQRTWPHIKGARSLQRRQRLSSRAHTAAALSNSSARARKRRQRRQRSSSQAHPAAAPWLENAHAALPILYTRLHAIWGKRSWCCCCPPATMCPINLPIKNYAR